jgi:hypothetical protein
MSPITEILSYHLLHNMTNYEGICIAPLSYLSYFDVVDVITKLYGLYVEWLDGHLNFPPSNIF